MCEPCGASKGAVVLSVQSTYTQTESETHWHEPRNHTVYAYTVSGLNDLQYTHTRTYKHTRTNSHAHLLPDAFFKLILFYVTMLDESFCTTLEFITLGQESSLI